MADEEFLKTLSKGGIENAVRGLGLAPRNTGKEMRAALLEHVGQDRYVLPEACFALQAAELLDLQKRIADDHASPASAVSIDDEAAGDGDGNDASSGPGESEPDGHKLVELRDAA